MVTQVTSRERLRHRKQGLAVQVRGMAVIIAVLIAFIGFLMALTIVVRLVMG